jgi:hypothetical protein
MIRNITWSKQSGRTCSMQEKKRIVYRILVGITERGRSLRKPRCLWEEILKWILERYDEIIWTGLIWLRIGTSGGLL